MVQYIKYVKCTWQYEREGTKHLKELIANIRKNADALLEKISTVEELEELRVKFLGKKGELTSVLKGLGKASPEERPVIGQLANEVRAFIEQEIVQKKKVLEQKKLDANLKKEVIDVTMPGRKESIGGRHPLSITENKLVSIFRNMGFSVVEGPEVELDYYNFVALNIPKNHPARDTQDTFYINDDVVLRSQTSPVQVRVMEKTKPPIRIISPGRVFRSDAVDATHSPVFHQMEGLVVDKGITMGDLKGMLELFIKELYGEEAKIRFRPHHFPFTEPSAEVDVSCFVCGGKGCRVCKQEGYIEVLGAGMVHPKVLEQCGIDTDIYSGFAFGIGLERIAMRSYEIDDMRLLYEDDLRFLKQF